MQKINYNTTLYNFRQKIQNLFNSQSLSELADENIIGVLERKDDHVSINMNSKFQIGGYYSKM